MYSFLICDLKNELNKNEIAKQIKKQFENADIIFLCTDKKIKKSDNYTTVIFDKIVRDDVAINSSFKLIKNNNVFVIRSGFKDFDILYLLSENNINNDIIMFKNNKNNSKIHFFNKIITFFKNLYYKLFNYYFYNGNIVCILFKKNACEVLKQLDNPATFTKIDKWVGLTIGYVEKNIEIFRPQVTFKQKWLNFIIWFCIFACSITVTILLYNLLNYVFKLSLYFLCSLSFSMTIFYLIRVYAFSKIGVIENQSNNYIVK